MTTPDPIPDDGVVAAELALGLIEGEERATALRRVMAEPAFAREVERWRAHFALLLDGIAPVAPPRELETRVMRAIDGGAGKWRWATAAASLMAAGLAGVLLLRPPERIMVPAPTQRAPVTTPIGLSAAMVPSDAALAGEKPFVAIYDPAAGAVRVAGDLAVPAGRDAQLWRIGADGVPQPLGLLVAVGRSTIALPRADRDALDAGVTLAVSIEPRGGSPTGSPTGPVVATGALVRI